VFEYEPEDEPSKAGRKSPRFEPSGLNRNLMSTEKTRHRSGKKNDQKEGKFGKEKSGALQRNIILWGG